MSVVTMRSITESGVFFTPNSTTEGGERDAALPSLPLFRMAVSLRVYTYPLLLLLGTFGNVMSIVIMRRLMTSESTVNLFFIALAVGDLLVLYSGIVFKWINIAFGVNVIDTWPALYYPIFTIYLGSGGFVSWILVCMTLQRAFSVAWPHHVSRLFTRGRVVNIIVGVVVFQVVLYIHHLYCIYVTATSSITGSQCIGLPSFNYVWFLDNVFIYIAMVLTSVLPFMFLLTGNGVLVSTLIISMREARTNIASGNSQLNDKRRRDTNSATITIIAVSFTFIVLTLPIFIYGVLFRFKDLSKFSTQKQAELFVLYTISTLMYSANSATNFYLYCLTGRRFREEFVNIFRCRTANTSVKHLPFHHNYNAGGVSSQVQLPGHTDKHNG